jgi:uncharacterized protein (TIGR04222 family)
MAWPLDTVAAMAGPQFLGLYVSVVTLTLIACRWAVRRLDRTADLPPALVPGRPDPVKIAYLRGGANEVMRLLIVGLLDKGQLGVVDGSPKRIVRVKRSTEGECPTVTEQQLLAWFSVPRGIGEVFQAGDLLPQVELDSGEQRERLEAERLLTPPPATEAACKTVLLAAAVIIGLGGFKLIAAVQANRPNVLFLIIALLGALVMLRKVCRPSRQTARGREYLRRLRDAYGHVGKQSPGPAPEPPQWMRLLVSLHGVGVLAETSAHGYADLFQKASTNGGFEVSADGCSSCGSGCGGCGGCGD